MTLTWFELASHGLLKKIPERGLVVLVMVHLRPLREKWIKDHGKGEVEKYVMENGIHGSRKLFESPYISKEMWCKAALRREFKAQWWWRAPEKRRQKCYNVVNATGSMYSASTWPPQPISGMPDELLKNDVHGLYETLDDAHPDAVGRRAVQRQWDDKWSREKDEEIISHSGNWRGTGAYLRAKWYQDIHEGRYFLFFKMNEKLKTMIWERRNHVVVTNYDQFYPLNITWARDAPSSMNGDIMQACPEWQNASDLLTIDGHGLNHSPGKEVMHIDDMFQ